ncbi:membrane spanning protein [Thermosipho africanus H17ap60334]|jgi:uncharacterized membrane protein|uniref:Membrane spanning protein n=1 Tax=Thermosipho africanus (strain TCF52B) TaxID=484019 RepID=B7IGS8_THEAB|nr:DMT family transporter [Thermosipho africanus]ACJ75292.1 membrane spanning protein [Thermosipho africanus TCF52B]EKF50361.1 membrane spanning protein [Thermosipho africanus H17ap60334]MDK2839592.1 hypothetical protein [Thermosipho sp. (in: thermotogales)]
MQYISLILVIIVWGLSFIATSIIVQNISPLLAAFIRFSIALLTLLVIPKNRKINLFNIHKVLAGFWGITIYFVSENFALKFTTPTNAALIVSTAPIWYVLFTQIAHKRKTHSLQYVGSLIALFGVGLVILNGRIILKLNPIGDLLAFFAAISWVLYTHHNLFEHIFDYIFERLAIVGREVFGVYESDDKKAARLAIKKLRDFQEQFNLNKTLKELNVRKEDLEEIAKTGYRVLKGVVVVTPGNIDDKDMLKILQNCY